MQLVYKNFASAIEVNVFNHCKYEPTIRGVGKTFSLGGNGM